PQDRFVELHQPVELVQLPAVHREIDEEMQPLAVAIDGIRELPILPGTRGQHLGPHTFQERQHLGGRTLWIGRIFVAVEQKHPLVSHVRQEKFSFKPVHQISLAGPISAETKRCTFLQHIYDRSSSSLQATLKRFMAWSIPAVVQISTASAATPISRSISANSDL